MNVSLRHLLRLRLLPLLCLLAFAACTQDDAVPDDAPVEVRLAVSADREETLPARQTTVEEGHEHEYMHELCVFIVDANGTIERRLLPDLSADADAQAGNLQRWTSYPILLTPGEKTLYAFANWSTAANDEWKQLVGQTEGAPFDVDLLNRIELDNPAAKINFDEGRFIPMAATTTATVTPATRELSIGLDRLVAKLRLRAQTDEVVGVVSCTFAGVASTCRLLGTKPVGERTVSYTLTSPTQVAGGYVFSDVYVNATYGSQPFTVTLVTDENAGTTYTAQTARTDVPRNSIYPLNLTLGSLVPNVVVRSWVSPIGSYPVEVETHFDADAFTVSLAEGSQFEFSIDGINGAAGATDVAAAWRLPATKPAGVVFDGTGDGTTSNALTVEGHLTTLPVGSTFTLGVDVGWTNDGKRYERHYTLTVHIIDITSVEFKPTRRLLPAERLWMN